MNSRLLTRMASPRSSRRMGRERSETHQKTGLIETIGTEENMANRRESGKPSVRE